nr:MAG TPA: hypothetical protein [Caudoviricetes sp.]
MDILNYTISCSFSPATRKKGIKIAPTLFM